MATPLPCWRVLPILSVLLLILAGTSVAASGDSPEFTYHVNATEVRLSFSATDRNNHGLATLQASDFAIVDKDVIVRNFQSFSRSDWTKLDLAILIDASESVTPQFHQEIADTVKLIAQTAHVPDQNLSILSFHGLQPALLCTGDCRISGADGQLPAVSPGGLTPLFDTIVFASRFLAEHGDDRAQKVLILFSDGRDTISRNSLTNAIESAQKYEVSIYCVDIGKPASSGAAVLFGLAAATGGRYFSARDGASRALNVILEDLTATYVVTYRLPNRISGFHTVRILPTHKLELQFRSRSGYYYPNRVQ